MDLSKITAPEGWTLSESNPKEDDYQSETIAFEKDGFEFEFYMDIHNGVLWSEPMFANVIVGDDGVALTWEVPGGREWWLYETPPDIRSDVRRIIHALTTGGLRA